jgi:hypothetical protein
MTTTRHRFAWLTSLTLLLALTAGVAANPERRPLSVTLDGNAFPEFQPDGCTIINNEHGTGQSLHLGAISWQSHEVVDICSNPEGGEVIGEFVLTAADGDQVSGTYQTLARFSPGQVRALGAFQITGGTGRFAAASGQGIISAVGSLAPPFGVLGQMSGVIGY